MKKVGIISLYHNSYNYGGVLQAYALNRTVDKLGGQAVQIDYVPQKNSSEGIAGRFLKEHTFVQLLLKIVNRAYKKVYHRTAGMAEKHGFQSRREAFDQFKKGNIAVTQPCSLKNISSATSQFDAFICGSDQIWKPTVVDDAYTLAFSEKGKPALSYAASLSVDFLNENDQNRFREWLNHLSGISVREERAVELLQPLTTKKVEWVCDPTLLISRNEWLEIVGDIRENSVTLPYLFCYFLGDDVCFRKSAKKYAKDNGLKIVTFPNLQQTASPADGRFGDYRIYNATPFEFVRLIRDAKCVMTDSFHATAFSLNLNVPFFVFPRSSVTSMNSRITSILLMTGCRDRFVTDQKTEHIFTKRPINWEKVNNALEETREQSIAYLKRNL